MESVEFGTTPAERLERLRGQLQGKPVGTRAAQRAQASRGAALLYGVMLHAASRLEAGLELTDLEERMVAPLRLLLPEEEVQAFGLLYRQETAARSTSAVLPETLTTRGVAEGYAMADLAKDLPALRGEILAQANVSVIDLDTATKGEGDTFDTAEFSAGQAAYGYGATVVTASASQAAQDPGTNASITARVDLSGFLCERESNEISVDDEIYWGLTAAGAFGGRQERLTRVYTNVDKNEWHAFDPNTTLYHGSVDAALVCNISCWEEDDGGQTWMNELHAKLLVISQEIMKFAEIMKIYDAVPEYGQMLQYAEVTAMIAYIVAWLINLFKNPDDLVQQRTLVFDQAALRVLAAGTSIGWRFDGGSEGCHLLHLKWVGNPPSADVPGEIKVLSPLNGNWGAPATAAGVTDAGPSMAFFNNDLYVTSRGLNSGTHIGRFSGGIWQGYGYVPNVWTRTPPALAVHNGSLHVGTCDPQERVHVTASANGSGWGQPVALPAYSSAAPALASRAGALHCAIRGHGQHGDANIYFSWLTGTTWNNFVRVSTLKTPYAPALTTSGDKLYLACVGFDGKTYVLSHDGSAWSAAANLGGMSDSAPAMGVLDGVLYCAVRGLDSHVHLNTFNGTAWSGFSAIPGPRTMSEPAIISGSPGRLHIAYRSTS